MGCGRMLKKLRKIVGFTLLVCALALIFVGLGRAPLTHAAGFTVSATGDGITLSGGDPLFAIDNMAPGDSAAASLQVTNKSDQAIKLTISALGESEAGHGFFNRLWVNVAGYSGPLRDLDQVALATVAAGAQVDIPITVLLPRATGNTSQGQAARVRFALSLFSQGPTDKPGGQPGQELPLTGAQADPLLPLGLALFVISILLLCPKDKQSRQRSK